ncbi:hypothetical protein H2248_011141 [Termitomyces sp. 'cryptogamus']|nr:hypothetical protein H2248_011141 [Termitomyces sp. 'cryptogamus']
MGLNLRKWFRKSRKVAEPQKTVESADVAMSELAESLRGEIQGLVVEIKQLRGERESLFRDIHDIMLSKCQGGPSESSPPPSPPLLYRKRSTQTVWLPASPISEDDATHTVEMGLFGPKSRTPSVIDSPSPDLVPDEGGSSPRPSRSMSETSQSSTSSDAPTTHTRTAWRVVEKRPAPIHLARTGATIF